MSRFSYFSILIIAALAFLITATQTGAMATWQTLNSLPVDIANHYTFSASSKLYVIGGSNSSVPQVSVYSDINQDNTIGNWQNTASPFPKKYWVSGSITNNLLYMLGGADATMSNTNSVLLGKIEPNGDIMNWQALTNLPQTLSLGASTIVGNHLYYAGGDTNSSQLFSTATKEIYKADINLADGTIGAWTLAGTLPQNMIGFKMLGINNFLYIFGGYRGTAISPNIDRAHIDPTTGNVGVWESLPPFPKPIWLGGLTKVGNTIVSAGGHDGSHYLLDVYYSTINVDGTISNWQASNNSLPVANASGSLTSWGNYLYLTGGSDATRYVGTVYSTDIFSVLGIPTPTPVNKVLLVPGLGASWNADAIMNCKTDSTEPWILAPYAADIYNPILNAIGDTGWTKLPFYYDWRRNIQSNSDKLANYVNENTITNEKVNFVGHSMGGLVGRGYLEVSQGGKLNSLLTVGSPNKGSALAYPPWAGGDIWNDNFIEKIALSIYLKHCGGVLSNDKQTIQSQVPSIQDLLPIEPYLKNVKSNNLLLPASSANQNTWLANLSDNPWGVKLGYIAGTGIDTLSAIQVKDPSKKDLKGGNWIDGKPAGRILTTNGDGTVLTDSAVLPKANFSAVINQTHRGLVDSVEGMAKILEFLGTPPTAQQSLRGSQIQPASALILIGYPSNFMITDTNGGNKQSLDGMVSFINPKPGSYKLNLLPKSSNTAFIIAQFLPNGDVKYKEYSLKGLGPKFKTINFDVQNPQEDILSP